MDATLETATIDSEITAYKIPLTAILKWPAPNVLNPLTRTWLAPWLVVLGVITTSLVATRIWARYTRRAGNYGLDDTLILIAWVFGLVFSALIIYAIFEGGFDRHVWDVPIGATGPRGAFAAWLAEIVFLIGNTLTKVSILLFHRRLISRSNNRGLNLAIWGAIAFTIVFAVIALTFLTQVCKPMQSIWESMDIAYNKPYHCIARNVWDPLVGAMSVLSDLWTLMLPEIFIRNLQMGRRQKVVLYLTFGSGIFIVITGIIRTFFLAKLSSDPVHDITWTAYEVLVWTSLEMQLAIIISSVPALKVIFAKYLVDPVSKATSTLTARHGLPRRRGDDVKEISAADFGSNKATMTTTQGDRAEDDEKANWDAVAWDGGIQKSFLLSVRYSDAPQDFKLEEQKVEVYTGGSWRPLPPPKP
ncbi:hypothetical protein K402DRAFT_358029 [Aulographum hederae CBS 113979]|uniref:Rhodopsin domain-containing protein n=1 Tax=Aulographum hederae CBS 113979 TaxID=1176131 RepID=A0A6G1GW46_9PEZI|nr:hypothetical protein K402DRAFT_358029 [Aulographum hederae CBS 113979]